MKKIVVVIMMISLFTSTFLFANGTKEQTQQNQKSDKIVFAVLPGFEKAIGKAVEVYKKKTGVEVVVHVLPRTGYKEALIGPLTAGSSEYDVIYIQNPWMAEFIEAGYVQDLNEYLSIEQMTQAQKDIFPISFKGGTYKDKLWALPWDTSTFLFFYRTDLIDNPPKTMDEYLELAKKFTKSINPDSPTKYGTVVQGSPERVNYQEWYNYLWTFGGSILDKNGKPVLNSPEAITSLKYHYGMKTEWNVVPPDVNNYRYPETSNAFQEGLVPMVFQWNAAYANFADPSVSPKIYNKFAVTIIPGVKDNSGNIRRVPFSKGWYCAINNFSKNKKAAADFIQWFTGPESGKIALVNRGLSSSIGAWEDPEVLKVRGDAEVYKETLSKARMTPSIVELPAIEERLAQALSAVLAGKKTPEEALNDVNNNAYKILKQSGRIK